MGSVGVKKSASERLIGQSVEALQAYRTGMGDYKKIREDFGLESASQDQIQALYSLFRGIVEYDRGYDDDKTPYVIERFSVKRIIPPKTAEERAHEKELFGRARPEDTTIQVFITTSPNTDNSYIKVMDTKYRSFLLGKRGSFYTYGNGGSRKPISNFDAHYGTRM